MLKLAPSILAADFSRLGADIACVERAESYLHIDVMDGIFVPNLSIGPPVIKSIRSVSRMIFDVHLMIAKPERYFEAFVNAGADMISFHIEDNASDNPLRDIRKIKSLGCRAAVAVKPATPINEVYGLLGELDMVLIMSVEPGFGGQTLIPDTLCKVSELADYMSKNNLMVDIEMDGGIYLSNARKVIDSGVNVLVAGSAVFGAGDIRKASDEFYELFGEYENKR